MTAFQKFIEGYLGFQRTTFRNNPQLFARLAVKQSPKCMVIACCDSRVDPAILTNADPGDLFILRNVANLVPPREPDAHYHGTSAALEFAVHALKVDYILVMGHANCGGVRALLEHDPNIEEGREFINRWMRLAEPARERTLAALPGQPIETQAHFCEKEVVKVSLRNLMTFPWIAGRVAGGELKLHGLYFDIAEATMYLYDPGSDDFRPLEGVPPSAAGPSGERAARSDAP